VIERMRSREDSKRLTKKADRKSDKAFREHRKNRGNRYLQLEV